MRRLLPLSVIAFALAGCGGTDIGGNPGNIYVGNWTGTWSDALRGEGGTITFIVSPNNSATGTISRALNGGGSSINTGTVQVSGQFTITTAFSSQNYSNVQGTFTRTGNTIIGSFGYTVGGTTHSATFSMTPTTSSGS
jgi:hypothetical protein